MPDYKPDQAHQPSPSDPNPKIIPFDSLLGSAEVAPEDDPAEWIYPHDSAEDCAIGKLVGEILEHDPGLMDLLVDASIGESPKSEMVRRINQWQSSIGSNAPRPVPDAVHPRLV